MNTIRVPLEGVTCSNKGIFEININGKNKKAVYFSDVACWFTLKRSPGGYSLGSPVWRTDDGVWFEGNMTNFSERKVPGNGKIKNFELPEIPKISGKLHKVPQCINYVWIGKGRIPEALIFNIENNINKCKHYTHIINAHMLNKHGIDELKKQFSPARNLIISDLQQENWFHNFMESDLGRYYNFFTRNQCYNLAAASDILRLIVLERYGGVYMDLDDTILYETPKGTILKAGENDLLLNRMLPLMRVSDYAYEGYGNSIFACCKNSNILRSIIKEMKWRLNKEEQSGFFEINRPWLKDNMTPGELEEFRSYIWNILKITGSVLLSDVLKRERFDYFNIEKKLLAAFSVLNVTPSEPRIIAENYLTDFFNVKKHYLPFSELEFNVLPGCARTWYKKPGTPDYYKIGVGI